MRDRERRAAFTEFVVSSHPRLRRTAYALCGDSDRAEDLLQTALMKLYVAWPRVRGGTEEAYVRQILVRASIDESRRPWRRERATAAVPDRPTTPDRTFEDHSELIEALRALRPEQRAAVVLRHWLGLSVAETARELGVPEGTVKSMTARGLAALRTQLERT